MRENKFRLIDKHGNIEYLVYPFDRTVCRGEMGSEVWVGDMLLEAQGMLNPDIHVGQYTGLKDKNGKEIYEGDVCRIQPGIISSDDPDPYTRIIKWNGDKGGFDHFRVDGEQGGSGWTFLQSAVGKYYEVIGNIYQHSHLLEEANEPR